MKRKKIRIVLCILVGVFILLMILCFRKVNLLTGSQNDITKITIEVSDSGSVVIVDPSEMKEISDVLSGVYSKKERFRSDWFQHDRRYFIIIEYEDKSTDTIEPTESAGILFRIIERNSSGVGVCTIGKCPGIEKFLDKYLT